MAATLLIGATFALFCGVLVALGFLALLSLAERVASRWLTRPREKRVGARATGNRLWHLNAIESRN